MKKIISIFSMLTLVFLVLTSCSEHELDLGWVEVDPSRTNVRLFYTPPMAQSNAERITRMLYNDQLYSLTTTNLGGAWPSAPRYHTVPSGSLNVKMFKGTDGDQLVYDRTVTVEAGKKLKMFVVNATEDPFIVDDDRYPFPTPDPWLDTCCYINFINLLHETDGTPCGPLTFQIRRGASSATYEYFDVATSDFKNASGWIKLPLKPANSGSESGLGIRTVDANGIQKTLNTGYSLSKGRYYTFYVNGKIGTTPRMNNFNDR